MKKETAAAMIVVTAVFCFVIGYSLGFSQADWDGDGISNLEDNCVAIANPDQRDADGDHVGDVCDTD